MTVLGFNNADAIFPGLGVLLMVWQELVRKQNRWHSPMDWLVLNINGSNRFLGKIEHSTPRRVTQLSLFQIKATNKALGFCAFGWAPQNAYEFVEKSRDRQFISSGCLTLDRANTRAIQQSTWVFSHWFVNLVFIPKKVSQGFCNRLSWVFIST